MPPPTTNPIQAGPFTASRNDPHPANTIRAWPVGRPLAAVIDADHTRGWGRSLIAEPTQSDDSSTLDLPTTSNDHPGLWLGALPYCMGPLADPAIAAINHRHPALWSRLPLESEPPPAHAPTAEPHRAEPYHIEHVLNPSARSSYTSAVRQAIDLIRAGDVFQVNLAHSVRCRFTGSARALFADLLERTNARYAAYLERPGLAVLSLSPELFLSYDPSTRRVETRPMKGTRPLTDSADLEAAPKDRAELAMIVDLMRNDLGRVCELGTVRVKSPRTLEPHGRPETGVLQAISTVAGTLRHDRTTTDLLHAAFPPGSITGAPKVRATHIIQELEQSTGFASTGRGYYCGAIGTLENTGSLTLNVAIRTITIRGETHPDHPGEFISAELELPVGAGIVADSDPDSEWLETLDKARTLLDLPASTGTPR